MDREGERQRDRERETERETDRERDLKIELIGEEYLLLFGEQAVCDASKDCLSLSVAQTRKGTAGLARRQRLRLRNVNAHTADVRHRADQTNGAELTSPPHLTLSPPDTSPPHPPTTSGPPYAYPPTSVTTSRPPLHRTVLPVPPPHRYQCDSGGCGPAASPQTKEDAHSCTQTAHFDSRRAGRGIINCHSFGKAAASASDSLHFCGTRVRVRPRGPTTVACSVLKFFFARPTP